MNRKRDRNASAECQCKTLYKNETSFRIFDAPREEGKCEKPDIVVFFFSLVFPEQFKTFRLIGHTKNRAKNINFSFIVVHTQKLEK